MQADLNYFILKSKCVDCGMVILTVLIVLLLIWYFLVTLARNNDRRDRLGIEIFETASSLKYLEDAKTLLVLIETQECLIII